jgi:hypothetical protein
MRDSLGPFATLGTLGRQRLLGAVGDGSGVRSSHWHLNGLRAIRARGGGSPIGPTKTSFGSAHQLSDKDAIALFRAAASQ